MASTAASASSEFQGAAGQAVRRAGGGSARSPLVDLALRLSLLNLVLQPVGSEKLRPLITLLAIAGLAVPALLRRPMLWWSLAALTGLRVALDYPLSDNHAYLLFYWCLALALAANRAEPDRFIAWNARMLIGLAFAFAVVWKALLSPDFSDGTFFRVSIVSDPRFSDFARLLGGWSLEDLALQREFLGQHADLGRLALAPPAEPALLRVTARCLAWWTLGIEALLALGFLWRAGSGPARVCDAALIVFCATTYAFATVAGFGWLLVAMGLAQLAPGRPRLRAGYLATFALILLYRDLRWLEWLVG